MENTTPDTNDFRFRRRPWTAVALSLLLPGMGHVYCGDIYSGISVIMIIMLFPLLWMVGTLQEGRVVGPFAFLMWGIVLLATLVAAIHAWFLARRTRLDYRPKEYNRWEFYIFLLVISVGGTLWYTIYFRDKVMAAYRVPSGSMFPSIHIGDRLIANKLAYQHDQPAVGDIVLFTNPAARRQSYIKRIVALPGDTVEMRQGKLWINDRPLETQPANSLEYSDGKQTVRGQSWLETNGDRTYTIFLPETISAEDQNLNFGPVRIPPYFCFVMGDNRVHSTDSRQFGPIPLVCLRGRFSCLYFPASDWSRFGPLR
jgi:signal peptidase I